MVLLHAQQGALEALGGDDALVLGGEVVGGERLRVLERAQRAQQPQREFLLEAAADLGATPWKAFWLITVPLSKSGIIAGSMLVFIPCVGEFVIPGLLGGPETLMIGRVLWDEFFSNNDWPMASSVAVVMILLILVPLAIFNRYQADSAGKGA